MAKTVKKTTTKTATTKTVAKKVVKKVVDPSESIDLGSVLASELNKLAKSQKVAYFLDDSDTPTNVKSWVSFGSDMLDIAVSNRAHGGAPVGRIVEVTGLEGSGKSLLSAHLLADTQKKGGLAVLIDTENAVSTDFMEAIGIDVSKLLYIQADSVEEVFEYIETIVTKVRETDRDKLVTIVTDSVAAASTKVELAADYDQAGYATQKAIIISKAMRKVTNMIGRQEILLVFTNQLRAKMNASFGDMYTTSGGKALAFHASVRLRLKNMGQIKVAERTVGMKTRVQVIKNRMGPPLRTSDFEMYFDRGVDNYGSWILVLKENKLIKQGGSWYTVVNETTGEEHKFLAKHFPKLMEDEPVLREQLYNSIVDATILSYKTNTIVDDEDKVIDTSLVQTD